MVDARLYHHYHAHEERLTLLEDLLLGVTPLIGDRAKKQAVRQTIGSVSLIHIAAHGNAERGESIFSSNIPPNFTPQEIISLGDV